MSISKIHTVLVPFKKNHTVVIYCEQERLKSLALQKCVKKEGAEPLKSLYQLSLTPDVVTNWKESRGAALPPTAAADGDAPIRSVNLVSRGMA